MRRVVLALAATAVGLVLLLSFKSHSVSSSAPRSALAGLHRSSTPSPSLTTSDPPRRSGTAKKRPAAARKKAPSGTFTGDSVNTRYGNMQVAAVVTDGRLTDVTVLQETDGGRSHEIDDASLPILKSEALSKHGANIDVVSGATYTSQGYAQSLQSALDKAGI